MKVINELESSADLQHAATKLRLEVTIQTRSLSQALQVVLNSQVLQPQAVLRPTEVFPGICIRAVDINVSTVISFSCLPGS